MTWLAIFLVAGAVAATGTLLHAFAVGSDMLGADILFNRVGCLTLSSYAAVAARQGRPAWALVIGFLFGSWPPRRLWGNREMWRHYLLMHGEDALIADLDRACDSLNVLLGSDAEALALIAAIRRRVPAP